MNAVFRKILILFFLYIFMLSGARSEEAALDADWWDKHTFETLADISTPHYTPQGNISAEAGYEGQCTWYAYGRFSEVTGIRLDTALHAKFWLSMNDQDQRLNVLYGADKIAFPSIAVSVSGAYGHVMFVEYVSMKDGDIDMVYFTECNADGNGRYDAGKDAVLLRLPYDLFVKYRTPAGYICAKPAE